MKAKEWEVASLPEGKYTTSSSGVRTDRSMEENSMGIIGI